MKLYLKNRKEDVYKDLERLWSPDDGVNQIKACLFNLVIYTHGSSRIHYFQKFIQSVIEQFPCRIIFVQAQPDSETDYLNTRVSLETTGSEKKMIVCDQIIIEAGGSHVSRVPFHLLPHLVPDLPIYLIWGEDPTLEGKILPLLQKYASRLIFASEPCDNLQSFCRKMTEKIHSFPRDVVDMNWARISGWRNGLVQIFDTKGKVDKLNECRHLALVYNNVTDPGFENNVTQAFYLQAWLASRLRWNFKNSKNQKGIETLTYTGKQRELQVHLVPQEVPDFAPGCILAFEAATHDDHFFTILRTENAPDLLQVKISSLESCDIPFSVALSSLSKGPTFIRELLYSNPSQHYQETIELASSEGI